MLPRGRDWIGVACLGVMFFAVFFVFYNVAMAYTTAARGALALSTLPLWTMVVAALLGAEALTARKTLGVLIAVGGVALALLAGLAAAPAGAWRGDLIMAGATLCMAFYNVWSRPFIARASPLGFVTASMGAGAACLVVDRALQRRLRSHPVVFGGAMDRGDLSRRVRRRGCVLSLGAGAAHDDADAGRQHHDGQPDRGLAACRSDRERADRMESGFGSGRGGRRNLARLDSGGPKK